MLLTSLLERGRERERGEGDLSQDSISGNFRRMQTTSLPTFPLSPTFPP